MTWLKIPWVPEDIFFLLILRHETTMRRKAPREKNNLWSQELRVSFRREVPREKNNLGSQELQVSFPCNFRIICLIKPVWSWCACLFSLALTAEIWSYETLPLRCMKMNCVKAYLERKKVLFKNKIVTNSFPKKYTSSCKYIKRTEVSWEVHTLHVFRSHHDKKDFQSATLLLLYQVKLNIARQNGYANKTSFCCIYLENKPRHKLSGIRKKEKTFCTQGTICENAELSPARQSKAGNHHIHSKCVFLVFKIQTKLLPRATLIQLSDVGLNYFEV